jgi:hypothetical protein
VSECSRETCFVPDTTCDLGFLDRSRCPAWSAQPSSLPVDGKTLDDVLLPWSGNALGLADISFLAGRAKPPHCWYRRTTQCRKNDAAGRLVSFAWSRLTLGPGAKICRFLLSPRMGEYRWWFALGSWTAADVPAPHHESGRTCPWPITPSR